MDVQTITIIVSSVALAVALESTMLCLWIYRKMAARLDEQRQVQQPDYGLQQLTAQLATAPDFAEEELQGRTKREKPALQGGEKAPAVAPNPHAEQLKQAYDTFYAQYEQIAADITVDNLGQRSQQLATLLLEMGYWLKDFLPVSQGDFNATSVQKANAGSIALTEKQWQQELAQAPLPNANPYETPLEVMALVQKMQQWGVGSFRFLVSGFRYQSKQTES